MDPVRLKKFLIPFSRGLLCLCLLLIFFRQGSASVYPFSSFWSEYFSAYFSSETFEPEFKLKTDSIVIPLKQAGRLFLIEATVDGEQGNLVFDTGANGLVINSTYFRNHVVTGSATSNGITGSVGLTGRISIGQIEFAGLVYRNLRADATNLGHIENRRGVKILGLLGFGMIRNLEIVFDAKNSELRLYKIDKNGNRINNRSAGFIADKSQEIETTSNILFLNGDICGKTLKFCFDTGAETNAISSLSNKKVICTLTITRRTVLKGAGIVNSEVLYGKMDDFSMNGQQISGMETIVTNLDALSQAYGTTVDGMLGYSFMEHGIVCINFVKKQFGIRFWEGGEK
jgi:predicted aspartyl protease